MPTRRSSLLAAVILPAFFFPFILPADASSEDIDALEVFFRSTAPHTVEIELSRADWDRMPPTRPSPLERLLPSLPATQPATRPAGDPDRLPPNSFGLQYLYVHGGVRIDGQRLANVGVRFKGNSSYLHGSQGLKHPFKLDFNRYVDSQHFLGLTKLNLNNNAFDDSQMRESLSYVLFREAGLSAPRTALALVYLTVDGLYRRQCIGLYTLIEDVNKPFLKSRFGSSKGLLLKPELRGRGLVHLGDDWIRYTSVYHPETDGSPQTIRRFIDFLSLIHQSDDATFARRVGDFLDVDAFLRFLAVNTLMANMDSALATGHNFYLYVHPTSGRIHWIPWDMNQSFGGFDQVGGPAELARLSINHPWTGPNRLFERLLAIDAHQRTYRLHLQRLAQTTFSIKALNVKIDQLQAIIDKASAQTQIQPPATQPAPDPPRRRGPRTPPLRPFITDRMRCVADQLDGKGDAYIPRFRSMFGPRGDRRPGEPPSSRPVSPP